MIFRDQRQSSGESAASPPNATIGATFLRRPRATGLRTSQPAAVQRRDSIAPCLHLRDGALCRGSPGQRFPAIERLFYNRLHADPAHRTLSGLDRGRGCYAGGLAGQRASARPGTWRAWVLPGQFAGDPKAVPIEGRGVQPIRRCAPWPATLALTAVDRWPPRLVWASLQSPRRLAPARTCSSLSRGQEASLTSR
jgi:hypothetical protein